MTAKSLAVLVLLIAGGIYIGFGQGEDGGGPLAAVQRLFGDSDADAKKLERLYQELEAKESILEQMDADIERMLANPPKPRCEGGTVEVSIRDDPRPELREEIELLQEEIAELEAEMQE
jgi:DNA repair exonuclease SbcCD ATPase subunit